MTSPVQRCFTGTPQRTCVVQPSHADKKRTHPYHRGADANSRAVLKKHTNAFALVRFASATPPPPPCGDSCLLLALALLADGGRVFLGLLTLLRLPLFGTASLCLGGGGGGSGSFGLAPSLICLARSSVVGRCLLARCRGRLLLLRGALCGFAGLLLRLGGSARLRGGCLGGSPLCLFALLCFARRLNGLALPFPLGFLIGVTAGGGGGGCSRGRLAGVRGGRGVAALALLVLLGGLVLGATSAGGDGSAVVRLGRRRGRGGKRGARAPVVIGL
jgi:hypothetical protein